MWTDGAVSARKKATNVIRERGTVMDTHTNSLVPLVYSLLPSSSLLFAPPEGRGAKDGVNPVTGRGDNDERGNSTPLFDGTNEWPLVASLYKRSESFPVPSLQSGQRSKLHEDRQ